ncbi:MAG: hypothetical protein O2856_15430, partial [Planctomycetota bacterium]|nr:hypothetical protein [Planctomycetota bacterium]
MDQSAQPAAHLMKGLRRLIKDIHVTSTVNGSGLTDVICGTTSLLSFGESAISYCGHSIDDLTAQPLFERVLWLLLHHSLPTEEQLADYCSIMADSAVIDQSAVEMVSHLPLSTRPLDFFPLCISLLSHFDPAPQDASPEASRSRVVRLLAQLPMILSAGFGETVEDNSLRPTELSPDETELS